jgi:hypothetical protein
MLAISILLNKKGKYKNTYLQSCQLHSKKTQISNCEKTSINLLSNMSKKEPFIFMKNPPYPTLIEFGILSMEYSVGI